MKRFIALLLCSFLFVGVGQAFAQPPEEEDPLEGLPQKPLFEQMKLTDQQKKQFEQMGLEMQKQLVGVRSKIQLAMLDMRQLQNADNLDKAAIEKKMNEIAQLGTQAASIRLNHWFEVNKILNAEQQKVWRVALKHPLRERARAWQGRRMMGGPGPFMGGRGLRPMMGPEMRNRIRERIIERLEPEKK